MLRAARLLLPLCAFLTFGCSSTATEGEASLPESTPPAVSPPPETTVYTVTEDLVMPPDSVRLGEVIYEWAEPAKAGEASPRVGEVERLVPSNFEKTGYDWLRSGDSNSLKRGTRIYAAKGYEPSFRVVARGDGGWGLYEVAANRSADRVVELLDVRGKTSFVSVRDDASAYGADALPYRRPGEVADFVDAVLRRPVARVSADYSPGYRLVFKLEDGTETARWYEPDSGELYLSDEGPSLGVVLPEKLRGDLQWIQ
jgi:hypothetical protein